MSVWEYVKLETLANFKNGLNYSKENFGKGIKVIGVKDFQNYNYPSYDTLDEIDPKGVVRNEDLLQEKDFLFVRSNGNPELIGRCLYINRLNENISHSGFTIRARFFKENIERKFYLYFFKSEILKKKLSLFGGGTNINNLNQSILSRLDVPLPHLPIQKKIAAILSAYDDLIEKNNRRISILEKMAEKLYKEWFVRLRFPGHEKTKIKNGIPEGWEVKTLGDIAVIIMGQSPPSELYNKDGLGLPFHQGVGTYGSRFPKKEVYCNGDGRIAEAGQILISVRAPVGRLNIADCRVIIGRGLASLDQVNGFNSYLYYMLKNIFINEDLIGNGVIFNSVGKDELKGLKVISPVESIIKNFEKNSKTIDFQIQNLYSAISNLKTTRDRLLSRLLSGKINVENLDIRFPDSMKED